MRTHRVTNVLQLRDALTEMMQSGAIDQFAPINVIVRDGHIKCDDRPHKNQVAGNIEVADVDDEDLFLLARNMGEMPL